MRYVIDIFNRFQSAYGVIGANAQGFVNHALFAAGVAYNDAKYQRQSASRPYEGIRTYENLDYNFADMELKYQDRILKFTYGSLLEDTDGVIAPPPVVRFRRGKNIGETTIDDGDTDSEIAEFFSLKNYEIDIQGLLIDMNEHRYPQSKVKELTGFFEINDIIKVVSPLFQDLKINSIYFRDMPVFEPLEGFPDTVRYSLQAKSIKPAEFSIINGK
ncbi:DUF6046 domain-containing protein [Dysgonomonas termitidis]|uniref:DUF6046 domain-containing protein n=1 Tax=Dysgonomonas termitidis TaxID=1516126 RepID=A0ABV9KU47_9BACT